MMNAEVRYFPEQGYLTTTFEGTVTRADLWKHIQSVWADPGWKPEFNGLMDFRAATLVLSDREMLDLGRSMQDDPRCSLGKWAFVVATASDFGKLRKVEQVADPKSTVRIFFDRQTATDWLLALPGPGGPPRS